MMKMRNVLKSRNNLIKNFIFRLKDAGAIFLATSSLPKLGMDW